jgi:hypothetical protein
LLLTRDVQLIEQFDVEWRIKGRADDDGYQTIPCKRPSDINSKFMRATARLALLKGSTIAGALSPADSKKVSFETARKNAGRLLGVDEVGGCVQLCGCS